VNLAEIHRLFVLPLRLGTAKGRITQGPAPEVSEQCAPVTSRHCTGAAKAHGIHVVKRTPSTLAATAPARVTEVDSYTEDAWPEEIKLRPDLLGLYTPREYIGKRRQTAALGRFADGRPCILLRIFVGHSDGVWRPSRHGASFTLPEFWKICVALNELLQKRPELGEFRRPRGKCK
jgi:hypothetical protein